MVNDIRQKVSAVLKKAWYVLTLTGKWVCLLRSLLCAIPVLVCAIALAIRNVRMLPEMVGINLLASGDYQWMVSRNMAVIVPLGITVVCLGLMFCSKKILYPWLISIFSLVLPLIVWVINVFPA